MLARLLAGLLAWLQRLFHPRARLRAGRSVSWFLRVFRPHTLLSEADRERSVYILGQPGVGKSRLIEDLFWQDLVAGRGTSLIDPAGDTFKRLVARLALQPELAQKVILLDPVRQTDWVIRLNPLAPLPGLSTERLALGVTRIVESLWDMDTVRAPRAVWVAGHGFMALAGLELALADLPDLLLSYPFRHQQLARLPPDLMKVRDFFEFEYPMTRGGARLWSLPIINKLDQLLFDPTIRILMSAGPALDFRRVMDEQLCVLAHLPKGELGEDQSNLTAAFLVARFQQAALSRANTTPDAPQFRPRHYLYLDEFQNYTTNNITTILSEGRKYQMPLVMSNQYLDQLQPEVQSAVLSTTGTTITMRVGFGDGQILAPVTFPRSDYRTQTETRYRVAGSRQLRLLTADERRDDLGWDGLAQLLANQADRSFWLRRKGQSQPVQLRTADTPDLRFTPELAARIDQLYQQSGEQFGVRREEAEAQMQTQEEARRALRPTRDAARPKRPRGRPKAVQPDSPAASPPAKRPRGRPKKVKPEATALPPGRVEPGEDGERRPGAGGPGAANARVRT